MTDTSVLVTQTGAVTTILLNRPDKLNALSQPLMHDLLQALETASHDPACRCVLISGRGRSFSAGADLTEFGIQNPAADRTDTMRS